MKIKFFLSTFVLLAITSGSAQATQAREFDDVPLGNWAYSALKNLPQMSKVKDGEPLLSRFAFNSSVTRWIEEHPDELSEPALKAKIEIGRQPLTRFEFAVTIARWIEEHPNEDVCESELKAKDITSALQREFQDEIARIVDFDGHDKRVVALENRVLVSPHAPPSTLSQQR